MLVDPQASYLVLHNLAEENRRIAILPDLPSALERWSIGTRVSPIWKVRDSGKSSSGAMQLGSKSDLLFLGPVRLARLPSEVRGLTDSGKISIWASMGCFNVAIHSTDRKITENVRSWAQSQKVPYEIWHLDGNAIKQIEQAVLPAPNLNSTLQKLAAVGRSPIDASMRAIIQENLAVSATVLARSAAIYPPVYEEFQSTLVVTESLVQAWRSGNLPTLNLQSRLISANAAISRFSSQAFSGVPPILGSECHFWIHSLLGTGSANIALNRLVGWVQKIISDANLPERIASLEKNTRDVPSLADLTEQERYLELDPLASEIEASSSPIVPLITYFSGRDGFSSHLQTLSAPLTAIAECNSYRSNLLTVTHEIAHILVAGLMTDLYPDFNDPQQIKLAVEITSSRFHARNWLESARQLLLEGIIGMDQADTGFEIPQIELPERLPEVLRDCRREAQEIIVHTLDFWYFYRGEPDFYVKSIWHSWCTIPEIQDRVPEYLMRTLCAVSVTLLREPAGNRFSTALREIKRILDALKTSDGATRDYISVALEHINRAENDVEYRRIMEQRYSARLLLVRLVAIFLNSNLLSAKLFADPHAGKGSGYEGKQPLSYDLVPIGNPLTFFRAHLKDDPGESESLWMLHSLAFDLTG